MVLNQVLPVVSIWAKLKSNMNLTTKDIERVAELARLELTEEEKTKYAEELSAVFSYMDMLNEVNTDEVTETNQVTGLEDVVREDVVLSADLETRKKLIAAFPVQEANLLKVQAVFKEAKK